MIDLAQYQYIVEKAITRLGLNPTKCLITQTHWQLKKDNIKLNIIFFEQQGQHYFKSEALITNIPDDANTEFYIKLLEYNHEFNGLAFYINDGKVYLKSVREVAGMDANEAFSMITKVGNHADKFDEAFSN
ncbi:MAG: YbjN domain-containing protein [Saprospiraceae bacterium]